MVNVSDNFKNLATQAGRKVFCKIIAGTRTFFDDKILEFDFDDVTHPDWFTIGTACANRFEFSVKYEEEIAVNEEIKPFISFDHEEWCPLGVFFVSRRYIRGNYASITCYDKMYSLDVDYSSTLNLPTTTDALLREICSNHGIICTDYGLSCAVSKIPTGCTVRDMIGYIAAMNKGCAKFDRNGALVLKIIHSVENYWIYEDNCMDRNRNLSNSRVLRITADTGDEILESGEGGKLSSIELYNPLMTQERLNIILAQMKPHTFYGAEIEMQGMPFLESGEMIQFIENRVGIFPIMVSEIDYHYDGALTAKLYSRNRNNTDPTVHQNDLEAAIEELKTSLGNICQKQINEAAISLSTEETAAAEFSFETKKANVFAQIEMNFTVDAGSSNTLLATVYVNGTKARESVHTVNGSSRELLHFYYLAENLPKGNNTIKITLKTASGQMTIQSGQLIATLIGKGMAGGQFVRDRQTVFESIPTIPLKCGGLKILGLNENVQTEQEE